MINSKVGSQFTFAILVLLLFDPSAPAQEPTATNVYTSKFDKTLEIGRWSDARSGKTPSGRHYLGKYGDRDHLYQMLKDLPEHRYVRVRFDLFILTSWDGPHQGNGPDTWSLAVKDGPLLLSTMFCNPRRMLDPVRIANGDAARQPNTQSYPDEYPFAIHKAATGASGEGPKLGFKFPWKHMETDSNLYKIDIIFPHTGKDLTLHYVGYNGGGTKDESWGIDKVVIDMIDRATPQSEEQLKILWNQIRGDDPVAANAAVWKVVAAGPEAAASIDRRWQASLGGKGKKDAIPVDPALRARFDKIVKNLGNDSFVERQQAQKNLEALGLDSLDLIVEFMNTTKDPELKRALRSSYTKLRRKLNQTDKSTQKSVVASRVAHIRRIFEQQANAYKITSSVDGRLEFPANPTGAAADGYFPEKSDDNRVPRFKWDPDRRGKQWLQYEFPNPKTISDAEVFWVLPFAKILPNPWHIEYKAADGSWKPVKHKGTYPSEPHKMNKIEFAAIETSAVRLVVELAEDTTGGVLEFRVSDGREK